MKIKNWTIKYIWHRIGLKIFELQNPDAPWLTPDSIRVLNQIIRRGDSVIEYGSGRSTLWFAKRCDRIISVEHNDSWYEAVSKKISDQNNVDYRLASLAAGGGNLPQYIEVLRTASEASFDILVNDGKLRHLVMDHGLEKVRPGGLIVLDNAERYLPNRFNIPDSRGERPPDPAWQAFWQATQDWRQIWTTSGVTTTLILFKPC